MKGQNASVGVRSTWAIRDNLVIYLFGTPGQERFWFMWDELASSAQRAQEAGTSA